MKYSDERREAILKKLFPPYNRTVVEVTQEEGISAATLYNLRKKARQAGRLLPDQSDDLKWIPSFGPPDRSSKLGSSSVSG